MSLECPGHQGFLAGALTALGHTPHAHGSFTRCDGTTASDWAQQVHKSVRRSHASFPSSPALAAGSPALSGRVRVWWCGVQHAHPPLDYPTAVMGEGQCKLHLAESASAEAEGKTVVLLQPCERDCFARAHGTACTWLCGVSLVFSQRLHRPGGETGQPGAGSALVYRI